MRIGLKIALGCLALAALVGVDGWLSSLAHDAVRRDVRSLRQNALTEFEAATDMIAALKAAHASAQELVAKGWRAHVEQRRSDRAGGELERAAVDIEVRIATLAERLATCRRIVETRSSIDDEELLDRLEWELTLHRVRLDALIQLIQHSPETAAHLVADHIEPHYQNVMRPLLQQYRSNTDAALDAGVANIETALAASDRNNRLVAFGAGLLAIVLALILTRSIALPIRMLAVAAGKIGSGDLDARVRAESADEVGQLAASFNRMAAHLQRTMVSKSDVDDILRSMAEILIVSDSNDRIRMVNRAAVEQLGWSEAELVGRGVHDIVHPAAEAGEMKIVTRDGSVLPVACKPTVLNDERGESQGRLWVAQNILHQKIIEHELRRSVEEKEVLLREVHHRVKNNLQVICSLLRLQATDADGTDVAPRLAESERRVRTMALIHEQLYRSGDLACVDFRQYVQALANNVFASAGAGRAISMQLDIDPVALDLDVAISCGLILNELLANALKHAFPGHRRGVVTVRFQQRAGRAILSVADDGVGMSQDRAAATHSLGLRLVRALGRQLGAETSVENGNGSRVTLEFDVPATPAAPAGTVTPA